MHNELRSRVARGLEPDAECGNVPRAADMFKMVYDCDLEKSAMEHAKKCYYRKSSESERQGLGENMYAVTVRFVNKTRMAEQASQSWSKQVKIGGLGHNLIFSDDMYYKGIEEYSQMVWGNSYKVGCAVEHCPMMTFVVCQYGPGGIEEYSQMIWAKTYKVGCAIEHCPKMTLVVCHYGPGYVFGL
ncbi:SCP-like protein, partial [Oesophagostomum dentatum]